MKPGLNVLIGVLAFALNAPAAIRYVDVNNPNPTPPYTDWNSAAASIQDAIDVAGTGDLIWVTNGVYATGGRATYGDLTNRVALTKRITVRSVNGAASTVIKGAWDPATTNGPLAVRCAWITNGATLDGFTLKDGATRLRTGGSPEARLESGGGVYGVSTNAAILNSILTNNAASYQGGGAYNVNITGCRVIGNCVVVGAYWAGSGQGGGAAGCNVQNCDIEYNSAGTSGGGLSACDARSCSVLGNTSQERGGGAYASRLLQCTVAGNSAPVWLYKPGGGAADSTLTNCVIYANRGSAPDSNYVSSTIAFSCSAPLPSGPGNLSSNPLLLGDNVHLATNSPCRGAGTPLTPAGTDIDGQAWASMPSIGCDEWLPQPVILGQPRPECLAGDGELVISGIDSAGQPPFVYFWQRDLDAIPEDGAKYGGTHTTNLVVRHFDPADAGNYFVVASNQFGTATSTVARVIVRCVDPTNPSGAPPYSSWASAAATLQEAIDFADPGNFVLATNGLYETGGRVVAGDLVNRVVVNKPITLVSANGPTVTAISGAWDPVTTNGPGAVRCIWLGEGATLSGFTLQNGATRSSGDTATLRRGGGIWSEDLSGVGSIRTATIANCILSNNAAGNGGGAYKGIYYRSRFLNNCADTGGGTYNALILFNCLLQGNRANVDGGGAHSAWLRNCTVVNNSAGHYGGGAYIVGNNPPAINSIVYFNSASAYPNLYTGGLGYAPPLYCCTTPLPIQSGTGSIASDPQLTDGQHIAATSPCRAAGSASSATSTDLDGEPWAAAPSIGCDEVGEGPTVGPLSVSLTPPTGRVFQGRSLTLTGQVTGRASRVTWDFGDASPGASLSSITSHAWSTPGDYAVTFTAYNSDNPSGALASSSVTVLPLLSPSLANVRFETNTFSFTFDGQDGVAYLLERATNLTSPVVWRTISSLVSTGGTMRAIDTQPTNVSSFYRLRPQ